MKIRLLVPFLFSFLSVCYSVEKQEVKPFSLQDIRLLESPFKKAQDLNMGYILEMDVDRLLAPYLREAGLAPKASSYTNWENTGLDGHIGGHYLSALALMYASTGDKRIKDRLDYMLDELERCQNANGNGYIGGVPEGKKIWEEVKSGIIKAGNFDLNGKWVPLYNIHKIYAGLRDATIETGSQKAKEMLIKMADWAVDLVSGLSDEQIQDMLISEHGGLNEIFADVAVITGDEKYMKLAYQFSHQAILEPLIKNEDKLTGLHANTQIPKVIGYKRIADIEGNTSWNEACLFFWENVICQRSVSIGGNSASEHFHPVHNFSRMIQHREGPETCNTYNMLRLSKMFFGTTGNEKYINYYEKALYNHILSSQHPETGGFVYFTQMRPGHYRVYSQPHTSFWCCVGSGLENHAKYGEMIYAYTKDELYVNLFIPSRLNWTEKDTEIIQENNFPDEPQTSLSIYPAKATSFTLKIRYPAWVNKGQMEVTVNGKPHKINEKPGSFISINRKWKKGDKIEVKAPMHLTTEQLPDKSAYYSFRYGPIVLAAKTTQDDMPGLFADDSRGGHIAHGTLYPLKEIPIVIGEPEKLVTQVQQLPNQPLTFKLRNLYSSDAQNEMELIPFFRLHDSRYIIYWPQATEEEVIMIKKKMEEEEHERIKLNSVTVDEIICGQQQPESDHFIKTENSSTGIFQDVHFREAKGWFGYEMKNKNANYLRIVYYDADPGRNFDIVINGRKIESVSMNGEKKLFHAVYYLIPEELKNEKIFNVEFQAQSNSLTAKIFEVRLTTEKAE